MFLGSWVVSTLTLPRLPRMPPNSPRILFFQQKMSTKANQKKSEKPSLPKTTFFTQFSGFPSFLFPIFINFGSILGLPGGCFLTFSAGQISNRFFHRFLKKICYFHDFGVFVKTLTPCRVACKTHGFGKVGQCEDGLEKPSIFPLKFHPKSMKNRPKNQGERNSRQKSTK